MGLVVVVVTFGLGVLYLDLRQTTRSAVVMSGITRELLHDMLTRDGDRSYFPTDQASIRKLIEAASEAGTDVRYYAGESADPVPLEPSGTRPVLTCQTGIIWKRTCCMVNSL